MYITRMIKALSELGPYIYDDDLSESIADFAQQYQVSPKDLQRIVEALKNLHE